MQLIRRALRETTSQLLGPAGIATSIGVPVLSLVLLRFAAGKRVMEEETLYVVVGLAAFGLVALLGLIFNLVRLPIVAAQEERAALKKEIEEQQTALRNLSNQLAEMSARPQVTMKIEQVMVGGEVVEAPERVALGAILTLRNSGPPSAMTDWSIYATTPAGNTYGGNLYHVPGTITLSTGAGPRVLTAESLIYVRTAEPVPTGAIVGGFLMVLLPKRGTDLLDCTVHVECRDVGGNLITASLAVPGSPSGTEMRYVPHMKGLT